MSQILGQTMRFRVNMGTTQTPDWKSIQDEISVTLSPTADKVEVANKDVGKHKKYIKLQLDHTLTVTAHENLAPATGKLSFADVYAMYLKNNADAGSGVYEMEFYTATVNAETIAFTGFVESCSMPAENNGLMEYNFTVQVVSLPTATTVV